MDSSRLKRILFKYRFIAGFVVLIALLFVWYFFSISPPNKFPIGSTITIEQGSGLLELSNELKKEKVIRSPFWFRTAAIILGGERGMQAGDYLLSRPQSGFVMAWRIAKGKYGIPTLKITIPEGFTVKKISNLFDNRFQFFNKSDFLKFAPEGYMFPDTYFIQENITATATIKIFKDNFIRKIFPLMPQVEKSGHTLDEIMTMASIIEKEAQTEEDRRIVSGILWKRISLGVPLQADSSLTYITGKTSAQLTKGDLSMKSPYNTYVYPGLPPGPISNPGIDSIEAALDPEKTDYLYFLTGNDGKMYYAETFDQHKANKAKYLR